MRSRSRAPSGGDAISRRFASFHGFFFDEFERSSAWLRDTGTLHLRRLEETDVLIIRGEVRPHPEARGIESAPPGLTIRVNGRTAAQLPAGTSGTWELKVRLPAVETVTLSFQLAGVRTTNVLAWAGRVTGWGAWQRFRLQNKNRQLRVMSVATDKGELVFDFSRREAACVSEYIRRHAKVGLNVVGFMTAELGVGESARCMVRAADAAGIPTALVPLKLHCKNRLGDTSFASRLQETNPHDVNVVHIDPPASRDIDHHHGRAFRAGKYNIAYFAWELPEFPDAWTRSFEYFDEVWCPSDFTTAAIAMKSPTPVLTMPHALDVPPPAGTQSEQRTRFKLPAEGFLFLTLFDLNSYAARKNPGAAIDAFRHAALPSSNSATDGAALVIKVQNVAGNERDFAALQAKVRGLPGVILLTETLSRADIYALEAACDCFVSLHRAEGFGLAVAETMLLGKPVISTDWSATAEFVTPENGCPVQCRVVALEQSFGPYAKGSTWADPDPRHAAQYMQALYGDRGLGKRLGTAARETIETRFSPAVIGARYRQRLEQIVTF